MRSVGRLAALSEAAAAASQHEDRTLVVCVAGRCAAPWMNQPELCNMPWREREEREIVIERRFKIKILLTLFKENDYKEGYTTENIV